MTIENQDNVNEGGLKKPENLYVEETTIENMTKSLSNSIESELGQSELKQQTFETNLETVGGEEEVKKIWNEMDEGKKNKILENINTFTKQRDSGKEDQADAISMLNPKTTFDSLDASDGYGDGFTKLGAALGTPLLYLPVAGIWAPMVGIAGTLNRMASSISLSLEKRKLRKLEKQYQ